MPRRAIVGCALFILCGCPAQKTSPSGEAPPSSPRAELVLSGGTIVGAPSGATSIAIDDGKIVEVGSDEEIKAWIGDQTRVVQLAGQTVLPGLVDAHMH